MNTRLTKEMMQERLIELINNEIDGLNSASEHQELMQHVSANEDAAKLYHDLLRIAATLKSVEQVPAPSYLKTHVMNSIHAAPARVKKKGAWLSSWIALFRRRQAARYAAVFASGLCVGLLFLVLATPWEQSGELDESAVSGSMAPFSNLHRLPVLESDRFEAEGVDARFKTYKSAGNLFIEIEVQSSEKLNIELNSDPGEFRFDGIRRSPEAEGEVSVTQGKVLFSGAQSEHALVAYSGRELLRGSLEGRVYKGNTLVHRVVLRVQ